MRRVQLDIAALALHVLLKHAGRVVKSLVDGGIDVLMREMSVWFAPHHQVRARNVHLDEHAIISAMFVVGRWPLDRNMAVRDAVGECCQLGGVFANVLVESWRSVDAAERDLNWDRHVEAS
jgi:hypothetical protein